MVANVGLMLPLGVEFSPGLCKRAVVDLTHQIK